MIPEKCKFLNEESLVYLEDLAEKIVKDSVIPFIGAGLSRNARRKDGSSKSFPLWSDLTAGMLGKLYLEDKEKIEREKYLYTDVADKFEAVFGRNYLLQFLDESLEDMEFEPGRVHRLISQFNWEIISTNFDTLIERGYELTNKNPSIIYTDSALALNEPPRIFKINGCINHALNQIIVTGEDFRTFGEKKPLIELYVKKCFIESTVLFIGFSLKDPAFSMIHGWVRDRLFEERTNRFAYSIQIQVDSLERKIWNSRGIRFIELFPNGKVDNNEVEERLYSILQYLYDKAQQKSKQKEPGGIKEDKQSSNPVEFTKKCLEDFKKKAVKFKEKCDIENYRAQTELQEIIMDCLEKMGLIVFFETISNSDNELFDNFIDLIKEYLCKRTKGNILYWIFKEVLAKSEEREGKIFLNKKVTGCLHRLIERLMNNEDTDYDNPNIWIMAVYISFRLGVSQKLLPIKFFERCFDILLQIFTSGKGERAIKIELFQYWMMSIIWIGPFKVAQKALHICRKIPPHDVKLDISEYIHYHLEAFFDDRSNYLDLFLRAVHMLRTSNDKEGLYKFMLLNSFLEDYKQSGYNDLFVENIYENLFGKFHEIIYHCENVALGNLSLNSRDLGTIVQAVLSGVERGKSPLFTGISNAVFSRFVFDNADRDILGQSSLCELLLLEIIYDNNRFGDIEESGLTNVMEVMIKSGLIDIDYFLDLLLFRVKGANLDELEQTADNGIHRCLFGLASFILCSLPHLEEQKLKEIKAVIQAYLPQVKVKEVREAMIRIVGYLSRQLPTEDFSKIYEQIFFIAAKFGTSSLGLEHLFITKKDLLKSSILKHSQLSIILNKSVEKEGTGFDRDFIKFMLNHDRKDLFPEDEEINNTLKKYFDIRLQDTSNLSLQWLIDVQRFIDKGFVKLNGIKKQIIQFIDKAFEDYRIFYEWKCFSETMLPVYRTLGELFKPEIIEKIIGGYLKNVKGEDISLKDLDERTRVSFARLLKEIYLSEKHPGLKGKILETVKDFIKNGFTGGGYIGVSWDSFSPGEKELLAKAILEMWLPEAKEGDESIIKALAASGEFLTYKTDEKTMEEISNRVLYSAFSGSTAVKIELCKLWINHQDERKEGKEVTEWFRKNNPKILEILNNFKHEKDLSLLRALVKLLKKLPRKDGGKILTYLSQNAPFAEIRRAAK